MNSLTEEQRKRIEGNRIKALEKRAAVLRNKVANESNSNIRNDYNSNTKLAPIFRNTECAQVGMQLKKTSKGAHYFYSKQSTSNEIRFSGTNGKQNTFSGKVINGNFLLVNKERFIVNMPYNAEAIEIFKTIPSKLYDVTARKWSFDLCDHSRLTDALKVLRPQVCIGSLPNFVLQALKRTANYVSPSAIDLMLIDPLLLEMFMPFQRDGVCFGVSRKGRVLIADDMGLGKTIQALGIASYYRQEWPLLIVAPSSVRYAWADAVDRWIGNIDASDLSVVSSGKDGLDGSVVIMSYDILSKRIDELKNINFQVVIMDESHMLKNFKSIRYKSASHVLKKAKRVILLSGTPALSRPSELYTQLSAIDFNLFPNFQDYGIRYCAGKQQNWGWDFSGSSNMEELNVILEATFMIRRLKSDVLSQLPSKQRMTIILDPNSIKASEKRMKEAAKLLNQTGLRGAEKHGALLQFFSESAMAKADAVCDYIKELLEEGSKKFLVFAHHKVMMDKISDTCEKLKMKYIRIDGSTNSEARQKLVDHFQTNADTRVAVLSITAANTGITLTAAQLVVFAELYWNPGFLVQAEDRVHRIGQVDSVLVQYLVAKGTADDIIWPLIQSKLSILNKVGLSKDNFSSASSANQKVESNVGIKKYFSEIKEENILELTDDEILESCSESPLLKKRKTCEDDDDWDSWS